MMSRGNERTIAVVTGTRAELGLLAPVMRAIDAHDDLRLRTIVTGTHLTTGTWRELEATYGLAVDARVVMQRDGEVSRWHDVAALGRGVAGIGEALREMAADVVLLLGDRIEAFAAAAAGSVGGLHVAHVHGGDRAEGVADEAMRHAITKLAHIHLAATAASRRRIIRMGERAEDVLNVGSPAIDQALLALRRRRRRGESRHLVVLQHGIGADDDQEQRWMTATLAAARAHAPADGLVVLEPNSDPGSDGIRRAIEQDAADGGAQRPGHLARPAFLALLNDAAAIIGNSSAGLIDAPALRVPCVNVGPRQAGREKPGNVVDCDYGEAAARAALQQALRLDLTRVRHPYGSGGAAERIAHRLAEIDLAAVPVRKRNVY
ncbi:MAG: UDP-N-acetylglucosamine 2-epimerase [Phycisphaeraceae bacterium]